MKTAFGKLITVATLLIVMMLAGMAETEDTGTFVAVKLGCLISGLSAMLLCQQWSDEMFTKKKK